MAFFGMRAFENVARGLAIALFLSLIAPVAVTNVTPFGATRAEAAIVSRIVVQGNTRVEAETIRTYLTIKPGSSYGPFDIDESIRALFATGLFSDVSIVRRGSSLVVSVTENPVINRVSFEGNDKVKDEVLLGAVQSQPRSVLTQARVQSDVQKILSIYRSSGRYQASVEPKIIELGDNRVNLVFEINEGGKTAVTRISFIGNRAFSDRRLRDVIKTREAGILSWLRSTDVYDPDRLNADLELLRRYYFKYGYADFRIVSAVADLDRERNVFFITVHLAEGDQYTFGDVEIETSLLNVDPEQLRHVLHTHPGDVYNAEAIEKTMEDLVIEVSKWGYAFAQIRPRGSRDYDAKTISITYFVDEGARAYVERINIRGNTRTRDYVIRREFDFAEGDAFNRALLNKAERRLNDLGFFKSVNVSVRQGSAADKVQVDVAVEEEPTGAVSFGAGYSLTDGFIGDISISEKNFLGRGQFVRLQFGFGTTKQNFEFSFNEPRFLGREMSAGFSIFRRKYDATDYRLYNQESTGFTIGLGFPLYGDIVTGGLRYEFSTEEFDAPGVEEIPDGINPRPIFTSTLPPSFPTTGQTISALGYSITYDTRDNTRSPSAGILATWDQSVAGLGGDAQYVRSTIDFRYYRELHPEWGLTGYLRARGGVVWGYGNDPLYSSYNFFLGGEKVRGFQNMGIGPRMAPETGFRGQAVGGRLYYALTAEATMPMPIIPEDMGFELSFFADAGSLWDPDPAAFVDKGVRYRIVGNDASIRASVGVGFGWRSPMGPLRLDIAYAVLKDKWDKTEIVRFGGGTRF